MEPEHLLLSPEGRSFLAAAEWAPCSGSTSVANLDVFTVILGLGGAERSMGRDSPVVARLSPTRVSARASSKRDEAPGRVRA